MSSRISNASRAIPRRTIDPKTNLWRFSDELDEPDPATEVNPESADGIDADDSDLEFEELPFTDGDDSRWEAFIPDDDECDPEPDPGDFWMGQIAD